jgi:hypothetical protein
MGSSKKYILKGSYWNKKTKEEFWHLNRNCLSREHLTKELIRAFSRRARQYICAYQAWHQQSSSNNDEITGD